MLKGPLSANRLNTHITHPPSFLISLCRATDSSQSWHGGADATLLHVSECHKKHGGFSNTKVIYEEILQRQMVGQQHRTAFGKKEKKKKKRKKKKRSNFLCNPFNLFHSGVGGVAVIIPIQVIKTSFCMCQRTAVFLLFFLFFAYAQGLRSISTLQTNFPISAYIHI